MNDLYLSRLDYENNVHEKIILFNIEINSIYHLLIYLLEGINSDVLFLIFYKSSLIYVFLINL